LFQQHGLESVKVKRDDDFICVWRSDISDVDPLRDIGGFAERVDLDAFMAALSADGRDCLGLGLRVVLAQKIGLCLD
jgi:hypothetical protein